jgi:hypothetical protein
MLGGAAAAVDPAVRDRIVQAAVKIVIEPIFEAGFQPSSFGFNVRHVNMPDALYAIRNGGFSGAIMPADVTGRQARRVAALPGTPGASAEAKTSRSRANRHREAMAATALGRIRTATVAPPSQSGELVAP